MSDFDTMNKVISQPAIDDLISLEHIISEIPTLHYEDPLLYILFMDYNKDKLTDDRKKLITSTIKKLKERERVINEKNIEFMNSAMVSSQ